MTEKLLAEALERHKGDFVPDADLQRTLKELSVLEKNGYALPKGYSLQSFEDKHRESAEFRLTVIRS